MKIIARDVMTSPVVSVPPEMRTTAVARMLADRHISAVAVTDPSGRLLGVVSEADLLRQVAGVTEEKPGFLSRLFGDRDSMAAAWAKAHGSTAADVMTPDPACVRPDVTLADVVRKLEDSRIRRVFVVDEDGRLIGVVSRADLLRMVVPAHANEVPAESDAGIAAALRTELRRHAWAETEMISTVVSGGVVTFSGFVAGPGIRKALLAAARNIPGVREVRDEMAEMPYVPFAGV
jgi:CBS domain-containing protein